MFVQSTVISRPDQYVGVTYVGNGDHTINHEDLTLNIRKPDLVWIQKQDLLEVISLFRFSIVVDITGASFNYQLNFINHSGAENYWSFDVIMDFNLDSAAMDHDC